MSEQFSLSRQACESIVAAFQKGLIEKMDITSIMFGLHFIVDDDGFLKVTNPEITDLSEEAKKLFADMAEENAEV